jgi:hypothetical protein
MGSVLMVRIPFLGGGVFPGCGAPGDRRNPSSGEILPYDLPAIGCENVRFADFGLLRRRYSAANPDPPCLTTISGSYKATEGLMAEANIEFIRP